MNRNVYNGMLLAAAAMVLFAGMYAMGWVTGRQSIIQDCEAFGAFVSDDDKKWTCNREP